MEKFTYGKKLKRYDLYMEEAVGRKEMENMKQEVKEMYENSAEYQNEAKKKA